MNAALEDALTRYVTAYRSGVRIDVESYCAEHAPISDALREAIENFHAFVERETSDGGATAATADAATAAAGELAGKVLGDFRIDREIGRGGMGVVYEAEQISLRRRVALKVLAAHGTLEPEAVERFAREASMAARLRHPGIVEVHAVGRAEGVHFFAMELVEGTPLDRWKSPSFDATCRVAEQVAEALEFAHRAGVVHRDVKPSNVIVQPDGRALLTDFGLAREEGLESLTRTGRFLGTPHYVPPEQAAPGSAPADHRADVYALGVTLFECLTGRRPFEGAHAHEVLSNIVKKEPPNPSRLDPRIAPDLSTIVLRAMEKDPARRYPSAAALAADLRAFLEGRPIAARPVGPAVRSARWARRNPALATAVALAVVLVVGGPIFFGIRERVAREKIQLALDEAKAQGERAQADFELARSAVDRMLTRVANERLRDEPRMQGVRKEILVAALELYQEFVARHAKNPVARAETARAQQQLAYIQGLLGETTAAIDLWAQAAAAFEQLGREHPENAEYRAQEAYCRRERSFKLGILGRVSEAEPEAAAALEINRRLASDAPGDWVRSRDLATSETRHADLAFKKGAREDAVREYDSALNRLRALAKEHAEVKIELAQRLGEQAWVLYTLHRPEPAEVLLREALTLETGSTSEERDARATTLLVLGSVLALQKKYAEALDAENECIELRRALVGEFPRSVKFRNELGSALLNLSALHQYTKDPAAEATTREALTHFEQLVKDFPESPDQWSKLAGCIHNLASILLPSDPAAALEMFEDAIAKQRRALEPNPKHPAFRGILRLHFSQRARALIALARVDEAETATADIANAHPDSWESGADAAAVLGLCLEAKDPDAREIDRERLWEAALEHLRSAAAHGLPKSATLRSNLAFLREAPGFDAFVATLKEGS